MLFYSVQNDFDIADDGEKIFIDIDLPEIEDMPSKEVVISKNHLKLNIKNRSQTQIRKDYMVHIYGIGFIAAGIAFSSLPRVLTVVISAYSQRLNSATGNVSDEYLYSAIIHRDKWSAINFENLNQINLIESFSFFELKRNMTKTGVFKPIEPFGK